MNNYAVSVIYKGEITHWNIVNTTMTDAIAYLSPMLPDCEVLSAVRSDDPALLTLIIESLQIRERMNAVDKEYK